MGKNKRNRFLCLAAAAAVFAAGPAAGRAMAYFTANAQASGGAVLNMDFTEVIPHEEIIDQVKHISIENTGETECYARIKIFAGEKYQEALEYGFANPEDWERRDDGYFYYKNVIPAEGSSGEMTAGLSNVKKQAADEDGLGDFNVIVVAECTAVLYQEDGTPYADWDADTGWGASVEQPPQESRGDSGEEAEG